MAFAVDDGRREVAGLRPDLWWLRALDEAAQRQIVRALAERYEIDMAALCRGLIMDWDEVRALAADPLVTIGAHTKGHYAVAKLPPEKAIGEMQGSAEAIERELGLRPAHFSFPYGDETSAGPATSRSPRISASEPR